MYPALEGQVQTSLQKSGLGERETHVALECPAVVHGEDEDDVTARVEGFGEDIEILGLGRPYALFRQSDG